MPHWYQNRIHLLFPSDIYLFMYQKLSFTLHFTDTKIPLSNKQWDNLILFSSWTVACNDRSCSELVSSCLKA